MAISVILFISLIVATVIFSASTSALTYQDSVDVSFTFDPTLSISLSSNNISIDNLVPGNFAHSNTITINVSTNNVYGYTLTAKVGEDGGGTGTSASSDLVNTSSNTQFTSLNPDDRLTLANFNPNTWGYTTSSSINNNSTTYSGLLYNTDTAINMTKNSAGTALGRYQGTSTTNFTIGANASTDQLSGTYTNTITFTTITNAVPQYLYMQDMTLSDCQKNVINDIGENIIAQDRRDGNEYTVRYINGQCWMTQNLRITGIISAEDSNFTGEDFNVSEYSPSSADSSYTGHCDASKGYFHACAKYSGNAVKGTWYNYYATTAGTIDTNNNMSLASQDICPLGWHLPARKANFYQLMGSAASGWQNSTAGSDAFGAVAGGHYSGGSLWDTSYAGWWSANAASSAIRFYFRFYSTDNKFETGNGAGRTNAMFVRCVLQ